MARRKNSGTLPSELKTADYRYTNEKRTNIPPAKMAGEGAVPAVPKARYYYSPHLSPTLRFDPTAESDAIAELAETAATRALTPGEAARLREALRVREPQLEWAAKREQQERGFLEVDPVALHIHERVSARAIVRAALREDVQRDMFADPQQPYQQAVQFYKHDVDWANRLILGDSLQVMSSLAGRENLAGKVQMIYMDPPYGIKFASNFQSEIGKRDVKDKEQDLTREPEMVKAYRDTWTLGVHSYLAYLRERLMLCRELLTESGSIFVQISDENLHRVRSVMDEVFGAANFVAQITYTKTSGATVVLLPATADYILWYARNRVAIKYRPFYMEKGVGGEGADKYDQVIERSGERRSLTREERSDPTLLPPGAQVYRVDNLTSQSVGREKGEGAASWFPVAIEGREFLPNIKNRWKTNQDGMRRLLAADRIRVTGNSIGYVRCIDDFPAVTLTSVWTDIGGIQSRADPKVYVVQTATEAVKRCIMMTTDPGDLVLDPTCGSGTTAYVAEQWGRRWITIDTSRVAIGVARQRVLTARFDHFRIKDPAQASPPRYTNNPASGFANRSVPHVTLKSIAQNAALDFVIAKYEAELSARLSTLNVVVSEVPEVLRQRLRAKLLEKERRDGKRAVTEADRRRWLVPTDGWREWNVPFDIDDEWPPALTAALRGYRQAWRAKMDEVNACIAANADQEELVDRPEVVKGVVRVSGPFTVEGVRPEEMNLGEDGLFDGTPNEFDPDGGVEVAVQQNLQAYLAKMVQYIRQDGLTFLDNKRRKFARVEPLFENATGAVLHAEGVWEDADANGPYTAAIGFGPQYGPVTALQVEELIRASKRYDELVVAGFSFDAEATAVIQEYSSKRLRIHQAYIRPDVNPGMEGLLKETPNSQLFTVFGTPEIGVRMTENGEWTLTLEGVDVYDPVANTVRSTRAEKVAAWFLDSDFDGRCFCITQAFFPDQDAWEKISKALGSTADAEAFEAFKGTESLPFPAGKHKRVAVKVIDPRGNEVMAVRSLQD
jgi:adenine-specific DNA-methyltransferase